MFEFSIGFLGVVVLWLIITICWCKLRRQQSYTLPPMYPRALPILGHSLEMLIYGRNFWDFMKKFLLFSLNNGKDVCTVILGHYTLHVWTNHEECFALANRCLNKSNVYRFAKEWLGDGLLTGSESIWKQHRKLLSPSFNQQILDGFLDMFNKESKKLANSLEDKIGQAPFDHLPYVQDWALVTLCSTTMGFHTNKDSSQMFDEYKVTFHRTMNLITQRILKFWLHNDHIFKWSTLKIEMDKALITLTKLINKVIMQKEIEMKDKANDICVTGKTKFNAYLELLIKLKQKNIFTHKNIHEEANILIGAGYDTTSFTVTLILVVLGSYPDVQAKVYKELREIFGGIDRDVSREDLSEMKYLEAVIKETLRLYPPVPMASRRIDKDICIRGYTLRAGDDFCIPIYALNRHSIWGPDVEAFRPERWLDPSCLPKHAYSFASFSIGRRNCIGLNYAMMTMKTVLAHVLRLYKISADINKTKLAFHVTLIPVSGHHITVEKRED